jgi:hypothetical protein
MMFYMRDGVKPVRDRHRLADRAWPVATRSRDEQKQRAPFTTLS